MYMYMYICIYICICLCIYLYLKIISAMGLYCPKLQFVVCVPFQFVLLKKSKNLCVITFLLIKMGDTQTDTHS